MKNTEEEEDPLSDYIVNLLGAVYNIIQAHPQQASSRYDGLPLFFKEQFIKYYPLITQFICLILVPSLIKTEIQLRLMLAKKILLLCSSFISTISLANSGFKINNRLKFGHNVATINISEIYEDLVSKLREINALDGISGLLSWDEMVMMPSGSSGCRGEQKAVLAGVIYDKKTDKQLNELLEILNNSKTDLNIIQNAVVRDALKDYKRTVAIPKALAQKIAVLETDAYEKWCDARKNSDFMKFSSSLQAWVDVNCERAAFIDPLNPCAYDVLLDMYEKGMTSKRLDEIFNVVRIGLQPFIKDLKMKGTSPDATWLKGDYDTEKQAKLCQQIALDLGFDLERGRLDVSVHPFTGGSHPTDIRMTTRFKREDLTEGVTGAIHETGHALYEQGRNLNEDWRDLPVNAALSMGLHESQSLLWERMVALSKPFQKYLIPKLVQFFPTEFSNISPEKLYEALNTLQEPSFIRTEADEVTYTMHVLLRYEIEKALITKSITVDDVPTIWNTKMQEYLGVTPPNDAQGCLQDMHWAGGAMGYFPTYTLGAMYATQLYEHAKTQIPNLEIFIEEGNFTPLRLWLNEKIHKVGSLYTSGDEFMAAVTGKPLDPQIYLSYLRRKYSEIYKLE